MAENDRYTQIGTLLTIILLLAGVFTFSVFGAVLESGQEQAEMILNITVLLIAAAYALILASFYSFTIQVTADGVKFWFGIGIIRRTIPLSEISAIKTVKNPWYYLTGIKSIPGGLLYGVEVGGMAVEMTLKNGRLIRLCTNRPEQVVRRFESAWASSS